MAFITTTLKLVTDLERIGDLCVNLCERVIELGQARDDAVVRLEKTRVCIDVVDDLLNRIHGVRQDSQACGRQRRGVVVQLANIAIEGLGNLDALPRARGLRGAAQRMTGTMQIFGDRIRRTDHLAARDVLTNGCEMARGFFGVDFVQYRIHLGLRCLRCAVERGCRC